VPLTWSSHVNAIILEDTDNAGFHGGPPGKHREGFLLKWCNARRPPAAASVFDAMCRVRGAKKMLVLHEFLHTIALTCRSASRHAI
jgi:hypothetical protein